MMTDKLRCIEASIRVGEKPATGLLLLEQARPKPINLKETFDVIADRTGEKVGVLGWLKYLGMWQFKPAERMKPWVDEHLKPVVFTRNDPVGWLLMTLKNTVDVEAEQQYSLTFSVHELND